MSQPGGNAKTRRAVRRAGQRRCAAVGHHIDHVTRINGRRFCNRCLVWLDTAITAVWMDEWNELNEGAVVTNPNLTHLYVILDRSGSMLDCREDMQGGFDAYLAEQARQPGQCRVSLVQFDHEYETVYRLRPIADVPPLQLHPRGNTALLDALGRTITEAGAELAALPEPERPGAVIVVVITDGQENASREYSLEQVRALTERQQREYSWLFVYLGANQDAISVGVTLGIPRAHTITYDTAQVANTYAALSSSTTAFRGSTAAGQSHAQSVAAAGFTDAQRAAAEGKEDR